MPSHTAAETPGPALDRAALDELRAEGEELLTELFALFDAEAPAGLATICAACERGDLKTAGIQAHRLKGSAAGLGAKRLQDLCGAVEQAARANQPAQANALLGQLRAECTRVQEEIAAERAAAGGYPPRSTRQPSGKP